MSAQKNIWKTTTVILLILAIVLSSYVALYQVQPAHAEPYTLNIETPTSSLTKMSAGQTTTLTTAALNGTGPFRYEWSAKLWFNETASTNFTVFSNERNAAFTLAEACQYINIAVRVTDAKGMLGFGSTTVWDPTLTAMTLSGGVYPGAPSYTIWTEGGVYYAKNAYGAISWTSTNASYTIQSVFDNSPRAVCLTGNLNIPNELVVKNTMQLYGDALLTKTGSVAAEEAIIKVINGSDTTIRDLRFDTDDIDYTLLGAVWIGNLDTETDRGNVTNITLDNLKINGTFHGIVTKSADSDYFVKTAFISKIVCENIGSSVSAQGDAVNVNQNSEDIIIDGLTVKNYNAEPLTIYRNAKDVKASNIYAENGARGITISWDPTDKLTPSNIQLNHFTVNGVTQNINNAVGLLIVNATNIMASDFNIYDAGRDGVSVQNSTYVSFAQFNVTQTEYHGFNLINSFNVTMTNGGIFNVGNTTANTYSGIRNRLIAPYAAGNSTSLSVSQVTIGDSRSMMKYAINDDGDCNTIALCAFSGNSSSPTISTVRSGSQVSLNRGYP